MDERENNDPSSGINPRQDKCQANGNPALCAFRPSCPTGFPGGVFVGFKRFWGFWAPPGGVSEAVRSRGSFGSILGVILRPILGPFWSVCLVYYVSTSLY